MRACKQAACSSSSNSLREEPREGSRHQAAAKSRCARATSPPTTPTIDRTWKTFIDVATLQDKQAARARPLSPAAVLWRTYFALYWRMSALHLLWTVAEAGVRRVGVFD